MQAVSLHSVYEDKQIQLAGGLKTKKLSIFCCILGIA